MSQYQVKTGPIQNDPAPFTSSMSAGYQPFQGYKHRQDWHRGGTAFMAPEALAFPWESTFANRPDSPRLTLWRNHTGIFVQAPDPTQAPFSPEMTQGYGPSTPVRGLREWHRGASVLPPDVPNIPVESTYVARPETPRLTAWRTHAGWFTQQPDTTPAPFTPSMSAGYEPATGFKGQQEWHRGGAFVPPDIPIVSIESTIGAKPDRPRLPPPINIGWTVNPPDIPVPFPIDSTFGQQPATSRAMAARKGPSFFPWSGTTDPPDQPSMFAGWQPSQPRLPRSHREVTNYTPQVDVFSPEQVIGSRPDRAVFFKGPRPVGWATTAHLTHNQAPFTPDMTAGHHPDRNRAFKIGRAHV